MNQQDEYVDFDLQEEEDKKNVETQNDPSTSHGYVSN
jgi:hypothetical protein